VRHVLACGLALLLLLLLLALLVLLPQQAPSLPHLTVDDALVIATAAHSLSITCGHICKDSRL
jgi:hypothetical protein